MSSALVASVRRELTLKGDVAAIALLEQGVGLHTDVEALQILVALATRRGDFDLASRHLGIAQDSAPRNAHLHALRAAVCMQAGDRMEALTHAVHAIEIDPGSDIAASIVVEQLAERLEVSAALRVADACLTKNPAAWGVRLSRVLAWMLAGEARQALDDADHVRKVAAHSLPARQNSALASLYLDEPASTTARRHADIAAEIAPLAGKTMPARGAGAPQGRPLRVGFVSADLRQHPVGHLMAPILRHMDRSLVELFVYSDSAADAQTETLKERVEHWRETRDLQDDALFDLIQQDRIDVLVDLAGYSSAGRPRLFATRCAPRQIGYLGHLHRTRLGHMDAILGDAFTLQALEPTGGRERALALPGFLFGFEPRPDCPPIAERVDGPLRFGSFNHLAKLSPATLALWARLLEETPGTTLTLCALGLADASVRARLLRRFAEAGCASTRIELLAPELDPVLFLERYDAVDIALDPLPFNGGMTSLQAAWQGVPTLTLPGDRMAARLGGSLMLSLGLDQLVARDADQYLAIGRDLAADPESLATIRQGLRERFARGGIIDGRAFADGFARTVLAFANSGD